MCNNVFKWFLRAFAVVAALTVISCADSPDEDDVVIPELSLSIDGTTVDGGNAATMTFDETGGTKQFSIKTTGEWEIEGLENAPQGFALTTSKGEEKHTGKGDETFTVTLGESTTASSFPIIVKVYASIFGQKKVAGTQTITIVQTKGGALPEGKVLYFNNFDKEEAKKTYGPSNSSYPYLDQFEGWKNQEGEGAAEVTYDFKGASARSNSKSDGSFSNYAGSGSNNIFFGTSAYFTIQNIAVSTTNLCLTFGTERYLQDQDNTFKNEEFLVTLSADGQSWSAPITYAFEEGNDTNGKWNVATANFTLPDETTKLYIKFASTLASAHRIDDVKLTDGIGGQAITFEGGSDQPDQPTPSTPGTMTVAELVAKCKAAPDKEQVVLDEANDVVVEAVVVTDKDGGNTNSKNLVIMAEGATEAGNGVMLYGSGITDPADDSFAWKSGDKVKVTLKAGQARACTYNGTYEITGDQDADWIAIEKIGTATITPMELTTVDNLAEYQSMVVKIKDATSPATAAEWCTADAFKTHTFTVGGSNLTVYVQKNAAAFVGKQFKASTTGDITGVVTVYKNNPQLAPRTADDVKAFNGEGGGDQPTPSTPGTMTVADLVAKCKAAPDKEQVVLDEANDVVVEAVVVTDKDGGNTKAKNLMIMAEGATEAGNGVMLYGSGSLTDPADPSFAWKSGDKVKVTLKAGQARACIYNGTYEITGDKEVEWIAIEKIGTATVTPVELTSVDNLAEYQSMVVKIKDATSPATAAEWCTADAYKTHTFTVGGSDLTIYVQKNAAAFVGKQFKASTTGDITGVVLVYSNAGQIAPRTADDVKAFNGEGGGDQPGGEEPGGDQPGGDEPSQPEQPTPAEGSVATFTPSQMGYANQEKVSSATLNDGAVTLAFAGGGTATAYYDSGASLRCYGGSTITVKSDAKISKIVIARGEKDKGNTLAASVGTLSEDTLTWTGESNEVVLTVSGTSGHIRIASMEITYGGGSSK